MSKSEYYNFTRAQRDTLRTFLKEQGTTQLDLASGLDLFQSQISEMLSNKMKRGMSKEVAGRLYDYLGKPPVLEFLIKCPQVVTDPKLERNLNSVYEHYAARLETVYRNAPEGQKLSILATLEKLVNQNYETQTSDTIVDDSNLETTQDP